MDPGHRNTEGVCTAQQTLHLSCLPESMLHWEVILHPPASRLSLTVQELG